MPDHQGQSATSPPPPRLSVRPWFSLRGLLGDTVRPFLYSDGDYTNAHINIGVWLGPDHAGFGVDLVVPPRLLWLIDRPLRWLGKD